MLAVEIDEGWLGTDTGAIPKDPRCGGLGRCGGNGGAGRQEDRKGSHRDSHAGWFCWPSPPDWSRCMFARSCQVFTDGVAHTARL